MIEPVPPPDPEGLRGGRLPLPDKSTRHQEECSHPRRQKIRRVIKPRRKMPEVQVLFILIPHHTVHRIDGFVRQRKRRAPDHHIKERGNDTIRKIFRDRLDCCPDHPRLIEPLRITSYDPGDRTPARIQSAVLKHVPDIFALPQHIMDSNRLITPERIQKKGKHRRNESDDQQNSAGQAEGPEHHGKRHKTAGTEFTVLVLRKMLPERAVHPRYTFTHQNDRVHEPGRIAEQKVQSDRNNNCENEFHSRTEIPFRKSTHT